MTKGNGGGMSAAALRRVGGHAAIDFVNTVDSDLPIPETLRTYSELIRWMRAVSLLDRDQAKELAALAARRPRKAELVRNDIIGLRETLRGLLAARLGGRSPRPSGLAILNRLLRDSGRFEVRATRSGFVRKALGRASNLDEPIGIMARLTADFLTSPMLAQLAACESGCGWFFIDRTPTRRRRWCSMASCGNRAKASRHYHRTSARRTIPT